MTFRISFAWRVAFGGAAAGLAVLAGACVPVGASIATSKATGPVYNVWHQAWRASLPYSNVLVSVEATSPHDAWAVGNRSGTPEHPSSYAVHWNGRWWTLVHFPDPTFIAQSVRASSRNDVWFFGYDTSAASNEVMRWDGSKWSTIAAPADGMAGEQVVLHPNDVWLDSGSSFTRAHGWRANLFHWNGQAWITGTLPMDAGQVDIAGSSDSNLWAAGIATTSASGNSIGRLVAYTWSGTAWRRAPVPRVFLTGPPAVAVSPSGEAWIVGTSSRHVAVVLHRVNGRWSMVSDSLIGTDVPGYPPVPDGLNGLWFADGTYWPGFGPLKGSDTSHITGCNGIGGAATLTEMDGIPGTHAAYWAQDCPPRTARGKTQGLLMISRPR